MRKCRYESIWDGNRRFVRAGALAAALALGGCAEFTGSLTQDNLHAGVSVLGTAYSSGLCASIGKTGICTKKDQKMATKVEGGLHLLIDLWPWSTPAPKE